METDGSVLEEKSYFKILGLTFSSKFDWSSYIMSITKTASKKIGALIHAMKFLSPDVALHSVHWGINSPPPQKHYPLFLAKPPLHQQTV